MNPVKGKFRPGLFAAIAFVHAVAVFGIWRCFSHGVGTVVWVLGAGLYVFGSLGITVGYHRYFTHGAFVCGERTKRLLAVAGALTAEGPLSQWCPDHRQHHRFTDADYDPHSPHLLPQPLGFLWAHVGWLFFVTVRPAGYDPSNRREDGAVIAWQHRHYWSIVLAGFVVPFLLAGWSGLLLAGFIRVVAHWHVTWMVNSVCHLWGSRPIGPDGRVWDRDQSRNNLLVAVLGMGEGYHGNHHVRQNSADLGFRWFHIDAGKWVIKAMQSAGVARDCRWSTHT